MKKYKIGIILVVIIALFIGFFTLFNKNKSPESAKTPSLDKSDMNSEVFFNSDHTEFIVKYPDGSGFSIRPPEPVSDWIFSNAWNMENGVAISFTKDDSDKSSLIYIRRKVYEKDCGDNISGLVACDKASFASEITELIIKDLPVFMTESGLNIYRVAYSIRPKYGQVAQYEETAYVDANGAADIIVLSSKTESDLVKMESTFNDFIKSYKYLPEVKGSQ